jgi:predicted CXXCH cytochrome family protein
VVAGLAGGLLVVGCSTETKQRWLQVFFTGVDGTNAPPASAAPKVVTNAVAPPATTAPAAPVVYMHPLYAERKCDSCHVTGQSEELRATGSALCLECHQKLIANAQFIHAPIRDGRCDQCHEAHKSAERFQLTHKAQELCLSCHKLVEMANVKGHASMGTAECLSCHDAHRSNQKYLARTVK